MKRILCLFGRHDRRWSPDSADDFCRRCGAGEKQVTGDNLRRGDFINDEQDGLLIVTAAKLDRQRFIVTATVRKPRLWEKLRLGFRQRLKKWREKNAKRNDLQAHVPERGEGIARRDGHGRAIKRSGSLGPITSGSSGADIRPPVQDVVPEDNQTGLGGVRGRHHRGRL